MARKTFVYRNGEIVLKYALTGAGVHYVISDHMADTVHPITGKTYDSKSEFRKVTKAHGCTEVGNDSMRDNRWNNEGRAAPDIARAYEQLSKR